jgi:hypothetical protein
LADALPASRNIPGPDFPAPVHQAMFLAWTELHGFTSLEVFGHMNWLPVPARDELFGALITHATATVGLHG